MQQTKASNERETMGKTAQHTWNQRCHSFRCSVHLCTNEIITHWVLISFIIDFSFCLIFFDPILVTLYTHSNRTAIEEIKRERERKSNIPTTRWHGVVALNSLSAQIFPSNFQLCKCLPSGVIATNQNTQTFLKFFCNR